MAVLKTIHLDLPARTGDLRNLEIGSVAYLTGRVFTAREGVYKRAIEDGAGMPAGKDALGLVNFHCSPAASVNPDGSHTVGAVTATASFRFAKWLDGWFQLSGCNIIIGKGGMTSEVYRNSFVPNQAIYLTTVGYGTGALLGRGIKRVAGVYWLEELGLAQAVWVLDVEKFGPFLVESDLAGNSLFERENAKIAPGLEKLYAGTKPATLRRYGETDDKTEEVIWTGLRDHIAHIVRNTDYSRRMNGRSAVGSTSTIAPFGIACVISISNPEIMVKSASAAPCTMIGLTAFKTKAAGTTPRAFISCSIHAVATPPLAASSTSTRPT